MQRLSAPFQLAYIAAAWLADLTLSRVAPGFVALLFDAIHLLRAFGAAIRWDGFPDWLDNEMARASLYVMSSYPAGFGAPSLPADGVSRLGSSQRLVGPMQRRVIHAMLDRYLIGGRPWDLALPPPVPGRYSLRHQFANRVLRRPG